MIVFLDGNSVSTQTDLTQAFSTAGTYIIDLVAYNNTCSTTHSETVVVSSSSNANFTVPTINCAGIYTFDNNTTGIASYEWFVDGVSVSTQEDLNYDFTTSGTYTIRFWMPTMAIALIPI